MLITLYSQTWIRLGLGPTALRFIWSLALVLVSLPICVFLAFLLCVNAVCLLCVYLVSPSSSWWRGGCVTLVCQCTELYSKILVYTKHMWRMCPCGINYVALDRWYDIWCTSVQRDIPPLLLFWTLSHFYYVILTVGAGYKSHWEDFLYLPRNDPKLSHG